MKASVFTNTVAPLLGTIICVLMYSSPVNAVMKARQRYSMGSLNAIPFGLALINAMSWCMYAIMLEDYYIFLANSPGVVFGSYCVLSSLVIMGRCDSGFSSLNYRVLEAIFLGGFTLFLILGMVIGITMTKVDKDAKDLLCALVANTSCVLYYGAPCTSMYKVIVLKDSSSLHTPMIFVNFLNAILWTVYGYFALNDMFVVVPNSIGLCLSILQLCLTVLYPNREKQKMSSSTVYDALYPADDIDDSLNNDKCKFASKGVHG